MKIEIPANVTKILQTIYSAGYEAYVVGGCVRDSILGREPVDWDVTTNASPAQIKTLFSRIVDTGIRHGTVTVMLGKEGYEVTTYRIDGEYDDKRHPREVTFTPDLEEDLKRRDFTINAMAYNDETGLVDLFGGLEDLEKRQIRCVGNAGDRFEEDALRIIRAIRFSAQLGFDIETHTMEAIHQKADGLEEISAERIQTELARLLVSDHPEALKIMYDTGVCDVILPEFSAAMKSAPRKNYDSSGEYVLSVLKFVPAQLKLRLAVLLYGISDDPEDAERIMRRFKFDNDTIRTVCSLVRYYDYGNDIHPGAGSVRRAMSIMGTDVFHMFLELRRADIMAGEESVRDERLISLAEWEAYSEDIIENGECVFLKDLAVSGEDLIDAGMKPGKEMGEALTELLDLVLSDPGQNTKENLLEYLRESGMI